MNIRYRIAYKQGYFMRCLYRFRLPWVVNHSIVQNRKVPVAVYSLSCEHDLPEQVANIHSFMHYVGIPDRFTIVSDGTYTEKSRKLLNRIHSCIDIIDWKDLIKKDLPHYVRAYADSHFLGKKLALLISLPINQTTIYSDSDILFFPAAKELVSLIASEEEKPRFLLDCICSFDERILLGDSERLNPANAGFILLKKPLVWYDAVSRLEHLKGEYRFHTEQTIVHLALRQSQGMPLSPSKFILRLDDQFIYKDLYASDSIALRHYVNPVRYKFWLNADIL